MKPAPLTVAAWVAILGSLLGVVPVLSEAEEELWEGGMRVLQQGPKIGGDGELLTVWTIQVRWGERSRIEVRNAAGETVGFFILLEDRGSTWTASRSGTLENRADCHYSRTVYEAEGRGEKSLEFGWIYLSDSDADPLADVLPHGSYFARADPAQQIVGTAHTLTVDCRGKQTEYRREDRGMGLSFMLGRQLVHPWDNGQEFISAETFRQQILDVEEKLGMQIRILDTEKRSAPQSLMSGRYLSAGAFGEDQGLYWQVTWMIGRVGDIHFTDR